MPTNSIWRRLIAVITSLLIVTGLFIGAGAGAASAADGRAGTGRGELNALYQHALGRAPDASGLNTFGSMLDRDCRQGVVTASYSLLTSPEADSYLPTPAAKVGSLYSALLDRVPDDAGWNAHHQSMLNGRSWSKVVTSVMASSEYRQRLDTICTNAPTSNATVYMGADNEILIKNLLDHGLATSFGCLSTKIPNLVSRIRFSGVPIGRLAAEAGQQTSDLLGGKNACSATARYFAAAAHAATLDQNGEAIYWRTVVTKTDRPWYKGGGCDLDQHIEIGTTPTDFNVFAGDQTLLICA